MRPAYAIAICCALFTACGGGEADTEVTAAEEKAFCDVVEETKQGTSTQGVFVALKPVAPTTEIKKAIEAMIAINDPEHKNWHTVNDFSEERCGHKLPGNFS